MHRKTVMTGIPVSSCVIVTRRFPVSRHRKSHGIKKGLVEFPVSRHRNEKLSCRKFQIPFCSSTIAASASEGIWNFLQPNFSVPVSRHRKYYKSILKFEGIPHRDTGAPVSRHRKKR